MEKINWKNLINVLFIMASCIELTMGILKENYVEIPLTRYWLWGFFFLYVLMMCCNQYTRIEKLVFVVTLSMGLLLYKNTGINTGIKAAVYVMALKGVDRKKLCNYMLFTLVATVLFIMIKTGLTSPESLFYSDVRKSRGFEGMRFCGGVFHPNRLQMYYIGMVIYVLLIYGKRLGLKECVGIMLLYFLLTFPTDSKTGYLIGVLLLIMIIFAKLVRWQKLPEVYMVLFMVALFLMLSISFLVAARVEKGFVLEQINTFISGRMNQLELYTGETFYNLPFIDSWKLFSDKNNKNDYDMGYIYIFYYFGIVIGISYLTFVTCVVNKARKRKDIIGMILITGLCVYLFMETGYYCNYLTMDFLLVVSAVVWWGDYEGTVHKRMQYSDNC